MVSTSRLVGWLQQAQALERDARAGVESAGEDIGATRDVLRHVTAARKSLEGWIARRQVATVRPDAR